MENDIDLLKIKSPNIFKYALTLMDALFTEPEMASSCFQQADKGTCSEKPPLSPRRVQLLEGRKIHSSLF
ncbi:hypothetical protein EMCRGX_G023359 [Ephydatia muelleri]